MSASISIPIASASSVAPGGVEPQWVRTCPAGTLRYASIIAIPARTRPARTSTARTRGRRRNGASVTPTMLPTASDAATIETARPRRCGCRCCVRQRERERQEGPRDAADARVRAISTQMFGANAATTEPAQKIAIVTTSTGLRPNTSPSLPIERRRHGAHEDERGEDPRRPGRRGRVELALQRRQRRVHDRLLEREREHRQRRDDHDSAPCPAGSERSSALPFVEVALEPPRQAVELQQRANAHGDRA